MCPVSLHSTLRRYFILVGSHRTADPEPRATDKITTTSVNRAHFAPESHFGEEQPHLETALLLRFPGDNPFSSRRKECRVGYSFCPLCIANQDLVHVRWEWCFASIIRCSVHRIPLQVACPVCSESDPLSFDRPDLKPNRTCWACGASLVDPTENCSYVRKYEPVIRAVEDAYRAALLGIAPHPTLVGKATNGAFRRFVDDMLQLLICFPQHDSDPTNKINNTTPLRPRQIPFVMISELIANAAPGWPVVLMIFLTTYPCIG